MSNAFQTAIIVVAIRCVIDIDAVITINVTIIVFINVVMICIYLIHAMPISWIIIISIKYSLPTITINSRC